MTFDSMDFVRQSFRFGKNRIHKSSFDLTSSDNLETSASRHISYSQLFSSPAPPQPKPRISLRALKRGPISKTISYLKSKMDIAMSSSSVFPTLEEVQRWKTDFPALLNNKYGCALFRQFLKKEFSDENVEFWLECEEFKKMKDGKKSTAVKAFEIYKEFVVEQASKEVNLDSDTRAATKAAVEDGSKLDMFNLAQSKVEQLMSKDSYRRFLKDRLYLDLLESFDENGTSSFDKK